MARRKPRILAFQALYSWDVGGIDTETLLKFEWIDPATLERLDDSDLTFSRLLITGTLENIEKIDELIKAHLTNWDFDRISKVDLAILRISVYPLLFPQADILPTFVIDEAIEISKEYSADDSFKFINAVLDNINKDLKK